MPRFVGENCPRKGGKIHKITLELLEFPPQGISGCNNDIKSRDFPVFHRPLTRYSSGPLKNVDLYAICKNFLAVWGPLQFHSINASCLAHYSANTNSISTALPSRNARVRREDPSLFSLPTNLHRSYWTLPSLSWDRAW